MKLLGLCVLVCAVGFSVAANPNQVRGAAAAKLEGHYWRDFESRIPDDALPSGNDNYYIGQLLTHRVLVPAQIDAKSKTAVFSYNGVPLTQKGDFKVLCTVNTAQFHWIKTNVDGIKFLLPSTKFIEGGSDDGNPLFIGRALGSGRIGKVTIYYKYAGLAYVNSDGYSVLDYGYEVIAYKQN